MSALSFSVQGTDWLLQNSVTQLAIQDVTRLLHQACACRVDWNNENASVQIRLPDINPEYAGIPTAFESGKPYPVLHYPEQDYSWSSKDSGGIIVLKLDAKTFNAVSFGLYGLLQEKLGFQFYHPREMLVSHFEEWPLPASFHWSAKPRFHKMGFHLHTVHPIELTEDLLHPSTEEARSRIREYIDWLARNQQNYFEFNLLESVHLKSWVENIKPVVEYGQQRGIIMGLDISLHMIQQKVFMLYQHFPNSFRSKKKQINKNLEKLCKAGWDVFDVEFSTTEFTKGNERKKKKLQLHLTDVLVNQYGVKPMGRMHVVRKEEMMDSQEETDFGLTREDSALDSHRGILIHTVMFYSLRDEKAPVYQNENLKHMLDALLAEQKQRETWYYPESAYWITFDNSVPMFLLPYLSARLEDILLCDSLDVTGHITFSSGWEWGYWLFDWSIARWSWKHEENGIEQKPAPTQFISALFRSKEAAAFFDEALRLQQHYIKDKELIRYLTAQTVTDEMPKPFNLQLQPRPEVTYKWMRKEADADFIRRTHHEVIQPLFEFTGSTKTLIEAAGRMAFKDSLRKKLFDELADGILITALRAQQRQHILSAILELREKDAKFKSDNCALHLAEDARLKALEIVRRREAGYRYPVELLAGKYSGHTSYNYGYLYPVHDLHFWRREEMQIRKDRWGPMFMSIWNIPRIIGLKN
ncbi:MAG TPA: hypothetical protein VNJ07_11170 [Chitinophagales bacterium]|nr:hypothetical protein [Chitinophagales bacterium]